MKSVKLQLSIQNYFGTLVTGRDGITNVTSLNLWPIFCLSCGVGGRSWFPTPIHHLPLNQTIGPGLGSWPTTSGVRFLSGAPRQLIGTDSGLRILPRFFFTRGARSTLASQSPVSQIQKQNSTSSTDSKDAYLRPEAKPEGLKDKDTGE